MNKKLLTILGILFASVSLFLVITIILFKIYSPQYLIPYVIDQVKEETKGRYTLSINSDSVRVHLVSMSLNLGYTEFKRDSAISEYSGIDFLDKFNVHATFQSFRIDVFKLINFLISDQIIVNRILLDQPSLVIHKNIHYYPTGGSSLPADSLQPTNINYDTDSLLADTLAWKELHQTGRKIIPYVLIKKFQIANASLVFYDGRKTRPLQEIHGLDFNVLNFVSDKNQDIEVEDASIHIDSASAMVSRNIARIKVKGVNIHPDSVHIDHLHFGHIIDPYRINRIKGFRASWLDINVDNIDINGIDPDKLISDSVLTIDHTSIGNVNLHLFKDKEEMVINPEYKALPAEQIRNIPTSVEIDTIDIKNADLLIEMEAPKAISPGRLSINSLQGRIFNVTNISSKLENNPTMVFNSKCRIEDTIKVNLDFEFDLSSLEDEYSVTCDVQSFGAPVMNPFLGSQFFIEFPKGEIDRLHFEFTGNNKVNVGTMDLEYHDLSLRKLQDYEKYIEGKPNTGFLAGIGNLLMPRNRSKDDKQYKQGVIYYEKEYNRDVIHCTIMSLVSGIASSVGLDTKNLEKRQKQAEELDESSIEQSAQDALQQAEKAKQKQSN